MKRSLKNSMFMSRGLICSLGIVTTALFNGSRADACSVITTSPSLPPTEGVYVGGTQIHTSYSGQALQIILKDIIHRNFTNTVITPLAGGDELEEFDSVLSGSAMVMAPTGPFTMAVDLVGPVQVISTGKTGNQTGTFATEIISMSLTNGLDPNDPIGSSTIAIRESPTMASTGGTSITDIGGGLFEIESFFDVHTELSIDGGSTWIQADAPTRVHLCPVPEVSSSFVLAGLLGFSAFMRKRS